MTTQPLNPLVNEITWADSTTITETPEHAEDQQDQLSNSTPRFQFFSFRS